MHLPATITAFYLDKHCH